MMNLPEDIQAYSEQAEAVLLRLQLLHDEVADQAYYERYHQLVLELVDCASSLSNYALKYFCFHMLDNLAGPRRQVVLNNSVRVKLFSRWPGIQLRYLLAKDEVAPLVTEMLEFLQDENWHYPLGSRDSEWLVNIIQNPYDKDVLKHSIASRSRGARQTDLPIIASSAIAVTETAFNSETSSMPDKYEERENDGNGTMEGSLENDDAGLSALLGSRSEEDGVSGTEDSMDTLFDCSPDNDEQEKSADCSVTAEYSKADAGCPMGDDPTSLAVGEDAGLGALFGSQGVSQDDLTADEDMANSLFISIDDEQQEDEVDSSKVVGSSNMENSYTENDEAAVFNALLGSQSVEEEQSDVINEMEALFGSSFEEEQVLVIHEDEHSSDGSGDQSQVSTEMSGMQEVESENPIEQSLNNSTFDSTEEIVSDDDMNSVLESQIDDSETSPDRHSENDITSANDGQYAQTDDSGIDEENVSVSQLLEEESANELLALIITEVHQLVNQAEKWASAEGQLETMLSHDQLQDYCEEINRIGAASEMIGMHAVQSVCMHVEQNLNYWSDLYPNQLESLVQLIPTVLTLLEEYLGSSDKKSKYHILIKFISSEIWPKRIAQKDLEQTLAQFENFVIEIEQPPIVPTPRQAQPEDVSIQIPEDVNAAVLDGMLQELPGQVETLSAAVIALRDDKFVQQLEVAKRMAHTLKGAANTVGVKGIANLTHTMEDVFEELFRASRMPSELMHRTLIDNADLLEQMTECLLGYGDEIDKPLERYQLLLDWANNIDQSGISCEEIKKDIITESSEKPATEGEQTQPEKNPVAEPQAVTEKEAPSTAVRSSEAIIDELLDFSGEQIILTTQMQDKIIASNDLLRSLKKGNQRIQDLTDEFEHLVEIKNIAARSSVSSGDSEFDPLEVDQFNELRTFGRRLMEACADNAEIMDALTNRVHAITDDCTQNLQLHTYSQKRLIQSSMVPVSTLVPRLKRALRQANNATGKSSQLQIIGEHTLVDRRMISVLGDSLLHLIRNAVDHGIEPAEQRLANGKPDFGTVRLEFIAHEDQILVRCSDDGAGLSIADIEAKAKRLGLIDSHEELDQEKATALILQHGFSTRDKATQLSGRGVGLDNVHAGLLEVNGSMRVTSQQGSGTQIEMRFPANLLYAQVLLVESNREVFAISTRGLEEILPANAGTVRETENGFEFDTGEHVRALYSLSQLLEYAAEPDVSSKSMLLSLRGVDDRIRVVNVDTILRSTEAVIKPLSRYLPRVQGVIGSTVMGDGRLVTVLDLQGLMIRHAEVGQRAIQNIQANIPVAPSKRILIAEDSVSTRRALEELARDLGYETRSAIDGVDATALMQDYVPDVVITDLEMPRMNGFELVSHIRANPAVSDTPVIMLTSRSTEKHRNEAHKVGVNAYLTKPFSEELLQEHIEQLLREDRQVTQNVSVR